ncbi:MAG: type II toxin-antitoxin system RelE/ParE family toxin [Candidatus Sumerlaeia bacterium]|nr:type II toxin-antitoxin system RelE/ParE family toxin [Candidatus Sumerlaeia bacterium]
MKFQITDRAELDLEEIALYIELDRPAAADKLIGEFFDRFALLCRQPRLGVERPDIADDIRVLVHLKWLIFYRIRPDAIQVVRVLHGAMDIAREDYP